MKIYFGALYLNHRNVYSSEDENDDNSNDTSDDKDNEKKDEEKDNDNPLLQL